MERRLAAILAADVVGYSRLMAEDEAGTLARIKTHRGEVLEPAVARHGGHVVKFMGDGALVEFPSVIDAVQCAVEVQRATMAAPGRVILLRIGVALGDVISDAGDIYGTGVNIAARLQEIAEPGGICISGTVHEQIEGKTDHRFIDLGTQQVKNIPKPVHVFGDFARVMTPSKSAKRRPFLEASGAGSARVLTGGCLCGAVRYEITKPAIDSGYCQCKMCQRFSGAPIIAGATYPKDGVRLTKGEPRYFRSSPIAERGFCPICGSSMFYKPIARRWTDWLFVYAGTMDGEIDAPPEWHLGVESHVPWLTVDDGLPKVRCDESPGLVEAYVEAENFSDE